MISTVASQQNDCTIQSPRGLSVWSFNVLGVPAWVLSAGSPGLRPQSRDMHVRRIENSEEE